MSWIKTSDRMTQMPDITNSFSQTIKRDMKDKETDTYDELNTIDPPYYLTSALKKFKSKEPSRAEKMAHVWATVEKKKSPPTSNSEDEDGSPFLTNVEIGLRFANLTSSAMFSAFNLTHTVADAVLSPVIDNANDYLMTNPTNENEVPTSSAEVAQTRERSRSRDNSSELTDRILATIVCGGSHFTSLGLWALSKAELRWTKARVCFDLTKSSLSARCSAMLSKNP